MNRSELAWMESKELPGYFGVLVIESVLQSI